MGGVYAQPRLESALATNLAGSLQEQALRLAPELRFPLRVPFSFRSLQLRRAIGSHSEIKGRALVHLTLCPNAPFVTLDDSLND